MPVRLPVVGGGNQRPTNQLVATGEWIFRLPTTSAQSLVVHVVHFANGQLARCKCGLILDLAATVQVLPAKPDTPPLEHQQCQSCWGITPDLGSAPKPPPEAGPDP